jgi:hypothetical protein
MKSIIKLLAVSSLVFCASAWADDVMENLKVFKNGGLQHGKWKIELLEGSDAKIADMMRKTGGMSICMDIAKQMAKDYQRESSQGNNCTHKVIRESASEAEVDVSCENGSTIHSHITRDSSTVFNSDVLITKADGSSRHMKFRYTNQGECTGDGVVQLDKNSPACKMMQKNTKGADMTAMCVRLQGDMREQCEKNMKNMMAACQ